MQTCSVCGANTRNCTSSLETPEFTMLNDSGIVALMTFSTLGEGEVVNYWINGKHYPVRGPGEFVQTLDKMKLNDVPVVACGETPIKVEPGLPPKSIEEKMREAFDSLRPATNTKVSAAAAAPRAKPAKQEQQQQTGTKRKANVLDTKVWVKTAAKDPIVKQEPKESIPDAPPPEKPVKVDPTTTAAKLEAISVKMEPAPPAKKRAKIEKN
jgi:hypothetical protein